METPVLYERAHAPMIGVQRRSSSEPWFICMLMVETSIAYMRSMSVGVRICACKVQHDRRSYGNFHCKRERVASARCPASYLCALHYARQGMQPRHHFQRE